MNAPSSKLPSELASQPASQLAVALDFGDRKKFFHFVELFRGQKVVLKIGLGTLPLLNGDDFAALKKDGFKFFIDTKLHDIPSQVARAVETWAKLGASFLTLHLLGASKMLRESVKAAQGSSLQLLGVSVLTSHSENEMREIGVVKKVDQEVSDLVKLGIDCGLTGFVSSVGEVKNLREIKSPQRIFLTTPGLVVDKSEGAHKDQARVYSAQEAVDLGADLLVIGRSIIDNPDPLAIVRRVLKGIGHE